MGPIERCSSREGIVSGPTNYQPSQILASRSDKKKISYQHEPLKSRGPRRRNSVWGRDGDMVGTETVNRTPMQLRYIVQIASTTAFHGDRSRNWISSLSFLFPADGAGHFAKKGLAFCRDR